MKENQTRGVFSGKLGYVLAASGSAVGLGNIWRFPYLAAKYGGGIFLLIYLILAVTFGFALMLTEIAIGRRTGKSVIGAYSSIDKRFKPLNWLAAFVPVIITPYYCVIGGWVLKYLWTFAAGQGRSAAGDGSFFSGFIGSTGEPTVFFLLFLFLLLLLLHYLGLHYLLLFLLHLFHIYFELGMLLLPIRYFSLSGCLHLLHPSHIYFRFPLMHEIF